MVKPIAELSNQNPFSLKKLLIVWRSAIKLWMYMGSLEGTKKRKTFECFLKFPSVSMSFLLGNMGISETTLSTHQIQ